MRTQVPAIALAAAGLLAAGAGCGGTAGVGVGAGAPSIVPASAPAFVSIDTNSASAQWRNVERLAAKFPDEQKGVDSLQRSMRAKGLDWREIRPALGDELDLVWLDLAHGGQDVVGLIQPKDLGAFKRAVARGNAHAQDKKLVYESVGGWVILSNSQAKLDLFKQGANASGPTLADDSSFKQAMHEFSGDALVKAYVRGPAVMDKLRESTPSGTKGLVDKLGTLDWLASSIRAGADGVRFDTTVRGEPGSIFRDAAESMRSFHLSLPQKVPGDALFYLAFHGSPGMFSGLEHNLPVTTPALEQVAGVVKKVGDLIQGEDALYVRPSSGRLPEVTLVAEPKPGIDGMRQLESLLLPYLGTSPQFGLRTTRIAGVAARTLDVGGKFQILFANVGGSRLVVTDQPSGIAGLVRGGTKLADSKTYSDAVRSSGMPSKVQSFLFVDIRGGLGLAQRLANTPIPAAIARNLTPLRSAVEYATTRPSELQFTFFVRIN